MKNVSVYIVQVTLVRSNTAMTWLLHVIIEDLGGNTVIGGLLILIIFCIKHYPIYIITPLPQIVNK
jgi:hypothetical protein